MKLMGNCGGGLAHCKSDFDDMCRDLDYDGGGGGEGEGGGVILVGVNLNARSKELLTWALVKVAQPGDRVIALHVIDPNKGDRATALSVMKNFDDSLLASYEGICTLKQVDLKLKICRGTPVHKMLAQEATSSAAMCVVVGTSATCKTRRSSICVARRCARFLGKETTVIAVANGKVTFLRESSRFSIEFSGSDGKSRNPLFLSPFLQTSSNSCTKFGLESPLSSSPEANNSGWQHVRKLLHHNGNLLFPQSSFKKPLLMERVLRLPSLQSVSAICPDQEQSPHDNDQTAVVSVTPNLPDSGTRVLHKELEGLSQKYAQRYRLFSYQELLSATSNFSPEHMIGKGGSSKVYKGILEDGKKVAVKIVLLSDDVSKQFVTEIELLSSLKHKNIISLLGFHFNDRQVLLIYDILSGGSLEDNLHGHRKSGQVFGWKQRYQVAVGTAEALEHIHSGVAEPIIHRDVKSSNILLSRDFDPKLSDFGLAMLASGGSSRDTDGTALMGTLGYLAPEYFMYGKVTDKIDVYSYGVVLLELLSGRKPIDDGHSNGLENLVTWAKPMLKEGKFSELLDPVLADTFDDDHIETMALAASLCTRPAPEFRPQITRVVQLLHGNPEAIEWARQQVHNSVDEVDLVEGEQSASNIKSFIELAFLNLEDDSARAEQIVTDEDEDHLLGRCIRASSSSSEQVCITE